MRLTLTQARSESGFTLIELVVALVLGLVVLVMLLGAITDMFGASERSANRSKAQRATVAAAEQLTDDLRSMRAPQREPLHTGSADNLRNLLLFEQNRAGLEIHDLLVATPTRITFFSETVNARAGVECVTWEVLADGSMQRTVRASTPGCGAPGAILHQSLVMPAPERARASAAVVIPDPFSYRTLEQPARVNVDPSSCTNQTRTTLATDLQRDQVVGIDMDLRSFVASRSGRGDQELVTSVSITSRQSQEYRFAIGCVA
jgi:prepilin-type N-terminal cleavage/methylation domain-containing protein